MSLGRHHWKSWNSVEPEWGQCSRMLRALWWSWKGRGFFRKHRCFLCSPFYGRACRWPKAGPLCRPFYGRACRWPMFGLKQGLYADLSTPVAFGAEDLSEDASKLRLQWIFTKWSNTRLIQFDQWSKLITGPILDRLRVWRGTARAHDAQGTPAQSHISPSILVNKDKCLGRTTCMRTVRP